MNISIPFIAAATCLTFIAYARIRRRRALQEEAVREVARWMARLTPIQEAN